MFARILLIAVALVSLVTSSTAADPSTEFIDKSYALSIGDDPAAFEAYVVAHRAVVGAAVAQLLDIACQIRPEQPDAAEENVVFAELVAEVHVDNGGNPAAQRLVATYRDWTNQDFRSRARAMQLRDEAEAALGAGEPDKAVALYLQAHDLAKQIGDEHLLADNLGKLGRANWFRGDFDQVFKWYNEAATARKTVDDQILLGATLNGLGSANLQTGNYDAALEFYGKARAVRERTGDMGGLGSTITYMGHTHYRAGRLVEAKAAYEEALPILEQVGQAERILQNLNGIANIYWEMGRVEGAANAYRRSVNIADQTDDPSEFLYRINYAQALTDMQSYNDAMNQIDAAAELLGNTHDPAAQYSLRQTRGNLYRDMGDMENARLDMVAALQLADSLPDANEKTTALLNVASLYEQLGVNDRGLQFAERALDNARSNEDAPRIRDAATTAGYLAATLGQYDRSTEMWELAKQIDTEQEAQANLITDDVGLATTLALQGKNQQARHILHSARARAQAAGLTNLAMRTGMTIGHTFEKENPDSAAFYYDHTRQQVESLRDDTVDGQLGGGDLFAGEWRRYYEEIALYYASRDNHEWAERAFAVIETAKARGLLDMMRNAALRNRTPEEETTLDALYHERSQPSPAADKIDELESQFRRMQRERLARDMGKLASDDQVAALSQVRKSLPKNSIMLYYALGDTASLLWVADRKSTEVHRLSGRRSIDDQIKQIRDAVRQPGNGDATLRNSSAQLYEMLIAPATNAIAKKKHIIVVPDGALFELPFELLAPTTDGNWSDLAWLGSTHAISYAPSASVLLEMSQRRSNKPDIDLLAVGDPNFETLSANRHSADLVPLPGTRKEVAAIAATVKEKRRVSMVGTDVSESAFKTALGERRPRIVHLATHGLLDSKEPSASSIALAKAEGSNEDGFLYTLEVLNLPFDVGLVVLSACDSGRGRISRGEGVVGLSRAFVAAGANGVVASLWQVSDESSAALMAEFYRYMLGKKKSAAEALRQGRRQMLNSETYSHPYHWAAFVATGAPRSPW